VAISLRSILVLAALAAGTSCGPAAKPYQPAVPTAGHGWWCTVDPSGRFSVCARSAESCTQAGDHMQKRMQIGTMSACAAQPKAHCFATEVPKGATPIADQCHLNARTCELSRSRVLQEGNVITACGVAD